MTLSDVKINHGSLQSDWTSAMSWRQWRCSTVSRKTAVNDFFFCFNVALIPDFLLKFLIEKNVNISNELNFWLFWCLSKYKLHWVANKVYMNPFGIHSLCTLPNVVYTSINTGKMKLHDPSESQLKLKVEFHRVPYNQTFDFVTGQFVKILSPACLWRFCPRPVREKCR